MSDLTEKQLNALMYLSQFNGKKLPSRRRMASELMDKSHGTIINHIQHLTRLGYISESKGELTMLKNIPLIDDVVEIGYYGTVSAGSAVLTLSEPPQSMMKVMSQFVSNPKTTIVLKVSGNSMTGANIQDGDLLIVDCSAEPKHNDIVIALVHGTETTCKRLMKEINGFYLKAENPDYDDIHVEEMEIQGVVKKLIREEVL